MTNKRNQHEKVEEDKTFNSPRQQVYSRILRIKDYVDNFDVSSQPIASLKPRLKTLQDSFKAFDSFLDTSIEDQKEREVVEELYYDLETTVEAYLDNESVGKSESKDSDTCNNAHPASKTVKLPTIDLPQFNGDYGKWVYFRDMYTSLIHENIKIGKIEKYYYLRTSLKGDAANVISNIEVSANSYDAAWELVRKRYDNNRMIINQHVRSIFELPKIDKPSSAALRTLLEGCSTNLRALASLKQPVEHWDTLIIHLVTSKLDFITLREWENSLKTDECPTWQSLLDFLKHRCQVNESVETTRTSTSSFDTASKNHAPYHGYKKHASTKVHRENRETVCFSARQHNNSKNWCEVCKKDEDHPVYICPDFKNLSIQARLDKAKALGVCTNCLRKGHYQNQCRSTGCKLCGKRHNTALHIESNQLLPPNQDKNAEASSNQSSSSNQTLSYVSSFTGNSNLILLSTAVLFIRSHNGKLIQARALLDSCSQSNFITEHLADMLQLKRNRINTDISGIGVNGTKSTSAIHAQVSSRHGNFSAELDFLVLRRITQNYPHKPIQLAPNKIPDLIQLADEDFHSPGRIDLLLGAELFYEVLDSGKIRLDNCSVVLQNTKFGWIVTGKLSNKNIKSPTSICNLSIAENSSTSINRLIERFWTVEERTVPSSLTREERECEDHFNKTVYRNNEGRFVVTLPIKEDLSRIGSTQKIASKRLHQVSKRLDSNPLIKSRYYDFMNEYVSLGHMIPVPDDHVSDEIVYHIPHHAVHKEDSSSTKLRVVFNASTKGTNGLALNECLMAGPVVQDDLFSITVRFRQHQFVLIADITKMYRQVLLNPSQYDLQRIIWWDDTLKKEKDFWLVTLTYGTTPASFLATRCITKLAEEEKADLSIASRILKRDFYVDDMITGCDSITEGLELQSQVLKMLDRAGMQLSKWGSNSPELLANIPEDKRETASLITFEQDEIIKTLGSYWNPENDSFLFRVLDVNSIGNITKRTVLSDIARLFDPLGLVASVIVNAKILMQKIWQIGLSWDDLLPEEYHIAWKRYKLELHQLTSLSVPRCIIPVANPHSLQMHGFCDASEMAYGACLYLRSIYDDGTITSRLIAVKSMKTHLKRIVGNSHLNSEELNTLLISIESILNSRPLYSPSSDPNDLNPLTPAHFLIGRPLTATLEPDLKPLKINTLSRWQRIQQLTQSFWSRWKTEYLCHLQNRYKWSSSSPNLKIGTVVLIKEDNVPALCWPLGRIEALHPGDDGLVRVVTVRSSNGLKKRSITKISPLPTEED